MLIDYPLLPQAIEVYMPALSSTMTEGKISQWLVSVGDKVDVRASLQLFMLKQKESMES